MYFSFSYSCSTTNNIERFNSFRDSIPEFVRLYSSHYNLVITSKYNCVSHISCTFQLKIRLLFIVNILKQFFSTEPR